MKTPERRHWRCSGIFIVNVEHILHLFSSVSIAEFEQVIAVWDTQAAPLFNPLMPGGNERLYTFKQTCSF